VRTGLYPGTFDPVTRGHKDIIRRASKLVDRLVPWTGARRALAAVLGDEPEFDDVLGKKKERKSFNLMTMMSSLFQQKAEKELEEDAIVVLHLSGGIVDGHKRAAGSIVSGPTVKLIEDLAENDSVKGVVVRINSPGGSATASEAILLALQKLAAKKPVACSMGYVAGSGGWPGRACGPTAPRWSFWRIRLKEIYWRRSRKSTSSRCCCHRGR